MTVALPARTPVPVGATGTGVIFSTATSTPHVVVSDSPWERDLTLRYPLGREAPSGEHGRFRLNLPVTEQHPTDGTPPRRPATLAMTICSGGAANNDDRPRADMQRGPVQQDRVHVASPQVSYFRSLTAANHNRRAPRRATVPKRRFRALVPASLRDHRPQQSVAHGYLEAGIRIDKVPREDHCQPANNGGWPPPLQPETELREDSPPEKSPKTCCCWIVRLRRFVTLTEVTRPPERHLTPAYRQVGRGEPVVLGQHGPTGSDPHFLDRGSRRTSRR